MIEYVEIFVFDGCEYVDSTFMSVNLKTEYVRFEIYLN